jgi:hypothetical protein
MEDLTGRLHDETSQPAPTERVCQGPFLSMVDYTIDVEKWGFRDPRPVKPTFRPPGPPKK